MVSAGEPVSNSAAELLAKLNIAPFAFGMKVLSVYDDGAILDPEIVAMTPMDFVEKFQAACRNV